MNIKRLTLASQFLLVMLLACASPPQTIEVTRLVTQELPVEVTRIVTELNTVEVEVSVEVPVEVTRLVEVMVTPTAQAEAAPEETAVPTEPPSPANTTYVVQAGDNLSLIAAKTGIPAADILTANNLTTASLLIVGQSLIIPGWSGEIIVNLSPPPIVPASVAAAPEPETAVATGANLLPNPSFEEGWYFFQGVSEWQIPNGWLLAVDEGANTLTPGDGGSFLRPEIRVVPKTDLPPSEHALFIFDGDNTIKAFKGGSPTNFAIFTDIALQPGAYRLTINFLPDIVSGYQNDNKVWATQMLSSEARIIFNNGGTDWSFPTPGQKSTLTYEFTLNESSTVRVGAAFRSRFVNGNNGWFLDDWALEAIR
jgi:LysM repeat protein